ncbi:EscU/YscU/HrcU family type III secretion system export apparatus switch protein [Paracoccus pacificus]|uniref:Flagellar biosynthesis protein FlhB n=1 Tax=Paracoccus pacificus TaxID=1463598 RepID=A0ABW4RBW4_9RHOB
MSEDKDDKQYDASPQKLRKAREKGDIPRTPEVGSALAYIGSFVGLCLIGAPLCLYWLAQAVRIGFDFGPGPGPGSNDAPAAGRFDAAAGFVGVSGLLMLAVMAVPATLVLAGLVAQRSIVFSPQKLAPDFSRINPVKNAAQKFGKSGLVTFLMSLARVSLVAAGGWYLFASLLDRLAATVFTGGPQWVQGLGDMLWQVIMLGAGIAAGFAVLDLLWKHHEHRQRNRMTRKEMEDEHKDSEGDPHMKAARRQKAIDLALNSMLKDVETADVVMVNPTHYAVALKWNRGSGRAPICVAKGTDAVAARIRARAAEARVPLWPDPPATRALYATVDIGQEIPADHFAAVAAAIRFAQKMRDKARQGW